jgi:hypothetical protein
LLLDEFGGIEFSSALKFMISAGTLILFVIYAHIKPLHILQPIFDWVAEGVANVNELLDWLLKPVGLILKVLFWAISFVLRPIINFFVGKSATGSQ